MMMEIDSDQCTSRWSEIPPEILQLIQSKLPVPFLDVRSLTRVCSWWRKALKVPLLSPLLLSLPSIYDFDKLQIFSPIQDNRNELNHSISQERKKFQNVIDNGFCVGFSHGWLVVLDKNLNLFLFNPFSGAQIVLPILDLDLGLGYRVDLPILGLGYGVDFVMDDPKKLVKYQCQLIKKAILTSDPAYNNDYKVIIIWNGLRCLAMYGNGDKGWISLGLATHNYTDIACHNKKIYALLSNGITEVWDLNLVMSPYPREQIIPPGRMQLDNDYPIVEYPWEMKALKTYFVISMEEIFYVTRYVVETAMLYRTIGFKVFKLNLGEMKLVEVYSLQNRCLFLGGNENKLIPCEEYQGFKGNCIYFLDDSREKWIKPQYPFLGYDMGVYCIKKRRVSLLHNLPFEPMPYWIFPRKLHKSTY